MGLVLDLLQLDNPRPQTSSQGSVPAGVPRLASLRRTHPQSTRHLHASLPLLRPRAQILQAELQAQAFLRAHRAHEAQGDTEGNPYTRGVPQPAAQPGTQVRSPFGAASGVT